MSDSHAQMIEAALKAWFWDMQWPTGNTKLDARHRSECRKALAAAFRAEADRLDKSGSWAAQIRTWLRHRAAELDGQMEGRADG